MVVMQQPQLDTIDVTVVLQVLEHDVALSGTLDKSEGFVGEPQSFTTTSHFGGPSSM